MVNFDFETKQLKTIVVFKLKGSLIESVDGEKLIRTINEFIDKGISNFILDMDEFVYMNSSGLSVIINALTKARKADGDAAICNISKKNNDILIITKLNSVFSVFETEDDAVNFFNE